MKSFKNFMMEQSSLRKRLSKKVLLLLMLYKDVSMAIML